MRLARASKPDGYLLGSYRIATPPEPNSSRLTSFKSTPAAAALPAALPILAVGSTPIIVDNLPGRLAVDPEDVVRKLTLDTVALLSVPGIHVEIVSEHRFAHPDVGVIPSPFTILIERVKDAKVGVHQHIDMVYVCRPLSQGIVIQSEEIAAYVWVPIENIGTLSTPPELHVLVAAAAKYASGLSYGE